jgi:hypothetical protein
MAQKFYASFYIIFLAVAKIGITGIDASWNLGLKKGKSSIAEWLNC